MFIPYGQKAKAERERRSKNRKRVVAALDGIMNCKSGLDHVLDQYDRINVDFARPPRKVRRRTSRREAEWTRVTPA